MFQAKLALFKNIPFLQIPSYITDYSSHSVELQHGGNHLVTINTAPVQVMMAVEIDGPFVFFNGSVI